ncbi:MAG: sensor domain-containing diguanylate cyclase [Lachnospiraceae bacterium]|nr:sensor domain-containing diguanylate cyclase [Lachnospiraceae bacterium]
MEKKRRGSIYRSIPAMCIIPLFLLGILIMCFCSYRYMAAMHEKVEKELESIAGTVLTFYDYLYPGEYALVTEGNIAAFYKGEKEITGDFEVIDRLKEETGAEITFFYKDTRMVTTIKDASGERLIGSGANSVICRDVLEGKQSKFYKNIGIGDGEYFGYYTPILNPQGGCVGMLAVSISAEHVSSLVVKAVLPMIFLVLAVMLAGGVVSYLYARDLTRGIAGIQKSLANVAAGDLSKEPEYFVMERNDELTDMGRSILAMQKELRVLIERDALTELYNRRCANTRLAKMIQKSFNTGTKYCIAIGDIDFFKKVNDTYGHEKGDMVLKEVSAQFRHALNGKCFAVRWGGEEFLFAFDEMDIKAATEKLNEITDKIRAMEFPVAEEGGDVFRITMTFGIVEGDAEYDLDTHIRVADERLYRGKTGGRNRIVDGSSLKDEMTAKE